MDRGGSGGNAVEEVMRSRFSTPVPARYASTTPMTAPTRPTRAESFSTSRTTWPRVAPSARSSAKERRRCATVTANVFATTRAAVTTAIATNEPSATVRDATMTSTAEFMSLMTCSVVVASNPSACSCFTTWAGSVPSSTWA